MITPAQAGLTDVEVHVGMNVLADMCRHAESTFPRECCGVVLGRLARQRVIFFGSLPAQNMAPHEAPAEFHMDWDTLMQGLRHVHDAAARHFAFYHSHPDGSRVPSDLDMQGGWPGVPMFIIPMTSGKAGEPTLWLPPQFEERP